MTEIILNLNSKASLNADSIESYFAHLKYFDFFFPAPSSQYASYASLSDLYLTPAAPVLFALLSL